MSIAVAYQVSPTGRAVLRHALNEARLRDAELAVLHVVESIDADNAEAYRLGVADEIERVLGSDCPVPWQLYLAVPAPDAAEAVLTRAADAGADLLIIGARRRSPVGKALMGSLTQSILLAAELPVLVVKLP